MTKQLTITIADRVFEEIESLQKSKKMINRSELVEELIRIGLKEVSKNGESSGSI